MKEKTTVAGTFTGILEQKGFWELLRMLLGSGETIQDNTGPKHTLLSPLLWRAFGVYALTDWELPLSGVKASAEQSFPVLGESLSHIKSQMLETERGQGIMKSLWNTGNRSSCPPQPVTHIIINVIPMIYGILHFTVCYILCCILSEYIY